MRMRDRPLVRALRFPLDDLTDRVLDERAELVGVPVRQPVEPSALMRRGESYSRLKSADPDTASRRASDRRA
jgi:biotin synthase-related radical SAM superfamily protein